MARTDPLPVRRRRRGARGVPRAVVGGGSRRREPPRVTQVTSSPHAGGSTAARSARKTGASAPTPAPAPGPTTLVPMSIATRVLDLLTGDEPNQPRLTWYGPADERVELSGRVLANWVTKATNLLVEEGEVEPGARVLLDIPVHWRALVWAMATWCAGGELVLPEEDSFDEDAALDDDPYEPDAVDDVDDGDEAEELEEEDEGSSFIADETAEEPDIAVTSRPAGAPSAGLVLVVALPALATQVDEPIPEGALDAAAALLGHGDHLGFVQEPADTDAALSGPEVAGSAGGPVTYGELAQWCRDQTPASHRDEPQPRVLCCPRNHVEMLAHAVAAWRSGGSLVLLGVDVDAGRFDEIEAAERAVVRC